MVWCMADKKRKSGRGETSAAHSRNAQLAAQLADEINAQDAPDSPTGKAFVASLAAQEPDTEVPGPSLADLETGNELGAKVDADNQVNPNTASSQPLDTDDWMMADQEAMDALDQDILAGYSDDMEASMEEDIGGLAEGISRRNPQWTPSDVEQQTMLETSREFASAASTGGPGLDFQNAADDNRYSPTAPAPETANASYPAEGFLRKLVEQEAASFFRFSGGPFPALLNKAPTITGVARPAATASPALSATGASAATPESSTTEASAIDDAEPAPTTSAEDAEPAPAIPADDAENVDADTEVDARLTDDTTNSTDITE